jgi:predicted RNA-binding Zn ribbon-like protein
VTHSPYVDGPRYEAPGDLELVRRFINTNDLEAGEEQLGTPAALARWLDQHGLNPSPESLDQADLERTIELREALRQVLLANNGAELPGETYERLNAAIGGVAMEVRFDPECGVDLVPSCTGIDAALARIVEIVRVAMEDGEWERLKVCPADDCLWAFYDRSRNHSRTWCSMEVCGNRAKVRTFRERHAT